MTSWLNIRNSSNASRRVSSIELGESSIIQEISTIIERILSIKNYIDSPEQKGNNEIQVRKLSGIRNDIIYNTIIEKYDNKEEYLKYIHDELIRRIWEIIENIINKNLSSKEIRGLNRIFSTAINQTEMKLNAWSKLKIQKAINEKIWLRFDFIGPIQRN